jgi:hypothetical protein
VEITEGVYSATGYAFSHLFFAVTHRSVVVIDTTESMAPALSDFRKISALPISHLIHATITPTTPARPKSSKNPGPTVIAQQLMRQQIVRKEMFLSYRGRVAEDHFAVFPVARTDGAPKNAHHNYLPPDVTFDDRHSFEGGGVAFELWHAPGETPDHTIV